MDTAISRDHVSIDNKISIPSCRALKLLIFIFIFKLFAPLFATRCAAVRRLFDRSQRRWTDTAISRAESAAPRPVKVIILLSSSARSKLTHQLELPIPLHKSA